MGAWGFKLYEDDVTCDIKEEYIMLIKENKDNIETTKRIINSNQDFIQDEDDGPLFWFALADIQWKYGRLLPEIKEQALKHLSEGKNLERWKEENPKLYNKRKEVLDNLRTQLESEQPPEKKIIIKKPFITDWKDGDLFAWKVEDSFAETLNGRYFLLYKIGEVEGENNSVLPLLFVKITNDDKIPETIEEINDCEFIIMEEMVPASVFRKVQRKEISEEEFHDPLFDRKYKIPDYRYYNLDISKNKIPKNLIYLGNYENIWIPKMNFDELPGSEGGYASWKNAQKFFVRSFLYCNKKLGMNNDENFEKNALNGDPFSNELYQNKYQENYILKKEYYDEKTFIRK